MIGGEVVVGVDELGQKMVMSLGAQARKSEFGITQQYHSCTLTGWLGTTKSGATGKADNDMIPSE